MSPDYPWYDSVEGDDIQQGDILENCPVFLMPSDFEIPSSGEEDAEEIGVIDWEERDVIIMSQSCDLDKNHPKVDQVLLCSVWNKSEIAHGQPMHSNGDWEKARKGQFPSLHILHKCELNDLSHDFAFVDFRRVYSLPIAFLRKQASAAGPRIRLLPPYREHLSQAFARFFMRVGLPSDIPKFS